MELSDKLGILVEGAKYDVACTSSGKDRKGIKGQLGNAVAGGLCHSFAKDGRCISLLKVLMTNYCIFDCSYCNNRRSNDIPRAAFSAEELAELTIGFYRRNYIEGLFLSSGVVKSPDYTMELLINTAKLLRNKHKFGGYIHAKSIPGASKELVDALALLVDRISVNLELPSEISLNKLAPDKPKESILGAMKQLSSGIKNNSKELVRYRHSPEYAPAGQSTQVIIGASPDSDFQIIRLAEGLYNKYSLKRVFYSAYIPVGTSQLLPKNQPIPLLREHRLYQADWLLRFYGFKSDEILSEDNPDLDPMLDPKCNWALNNLHLFPIEVNTADIELLLRVPGIGPTTARRIVQARNTCKLNFEHLKKLRIVLKRAVYFITCNGKAYPGVKIDRDYIYYNLVTDAKRTVGGLPVFYTPEQMTLFAPANKILARSEVAF